MSFQIENIKQIMDALDFGALLPELDSVVAFLYLFARLAVMAGPLLVLGLGLYYFLCAPKEATYLAGYRFRWGMASVEAWQYMQKCAGIFWGILGLVLSIAGALSVSKFGQMEIMDALWQTAKLLVVQALCVLVSCGVINLLVLTRFDRKGRRRLTWRELFEA